MGTKNFSEALGNVILRQTHRSRTATVYIDPEGAQEKYEKTNGEHGFYKEAAIIIKEDNCRDMYIALIQRTPDSDCESHT